MAGNDVVIFAMGDRVCNRDDYEVQFAPLLPLLRQADIRYCQIEQLFAERGEPCVSASSLVWRMHPKYIASLKYTGIDVGSANGNHALEYGHDAFLDTLANLDENGIKTCGAGHDIEEARKPAILERKGARIAFLAYNSIIGTGEAADYNWPGVAPMRVHTYYEPLEHNQPGMPPRIHTFADRHDLDAMKEDIARAKLVADVVMVALHFGIHYVRAQMAGYQPEVCHAAIDAGADVILGTHPHVLKAIEVYRGKVIFYSLGNFACDPMQRWTKEGVASASVKAITEAIGAKDDPDYPFLKSRPRDVMKTGIAKIVVSSKEVKRVSFIPMVTSADREMQPRSLSPDNPEFKDMVTYVGDITREAGIATEFRVEGGEMVVVT